MQKKSIYFSIKLFYLPCLRSHFFHSFIHLARFSLNDKFILRRVFELEQFLCCPIEQFILNIKYFQSIP